MNEADQKAGLPAIQKAVLAFVATVLVVLFILWFSNFYLDKPILGIGEIEGFGRSLPQTASEPPMTWRFAPTVGHAAVRHRIEPAAVPSEFRRLETMAQGAAATVYRVSYLSDSQVVYGALGVPAGDGPHPGMVVCHPADDGYTTGYHTLDTVKALAEMGVVAFSTDYRGWGKSEGSRGNEVRDVWNALAALRSTPGVNREKIGLAGFSMGGGIAAQAAVADTDIDLLVLYYPQMLGSLEELRSYLAYNTVEPGMGGVVQLAQNGRAAGADRRELEYTLRMLSPIYHLDEFPGFVALFHSLDDQVVSVRQSEAVAKERRAAGRPVALETPEKLGHAFANSIENPTKEKFLALVREHLL